MKVEIFENFENFWKKNEKNWKCWNFWKLLELLELFGNSTHPANPILFYLSIYSTRICPLFCRLVLEICYKWVKKRKKYSWRLLRRNNLSEICNSPGKTLKVIPGAAGCWPQFSPSDKTISHRVTESLGNRVSCTLLNVSFTCVPAVL